MVLVYTFGIDVVSEPLLLGVSVGTVGVVCPADDTPVRYVINIMFIARKFIFVLFL